MAVGERCELDVDLEQGLLSLEGHETIEHGAPAVDRPDDDDRERNDAEEGEEDRKGRLSTHAEVDTISLKSARALPFKTFMRSTVRHRSVAIGLILALAGIACTPGGAAGGLGDENFSDGLNGAPFGPSAKAAEPAPPALAPTGVGTHSYQTTASVGDFLQITLDKEAHTATYLNKTNGLTARDFPYALDGKGGYAFADPNGHLRAAVELEDHALVVDVDKAGPNRDTRALAIGAATQPISLADLADRTLNMMQFRTRNGGMEVGNVVLATRGNGLTVDLQRYWPRGAMANGAPPFHVGLMGTLPVQEGPGEHDFLTLAETARGVTTMDYVFKTSSGLAIDMSNGNIVMLEQPASKDMDPASEGSYRALAYRKQGARGGPDDEREPGELTVGFLDMAVNAAGHFLAVDHDHEVLIDDDLVPVPDVSYLTGAGKLDPARSKGIFTFRTHGPTGNRDVFVIFTRTGLLFSSFTGRVPEGGGDAPYDYFYGAAVKR